MARTIKLKKWIAASALALGWLILVAVEIHIVSRGFGKVEGDAEHVPVSQQ